MPFMFSSYLPFRLISLLIVLSLVRPLLGQTEKLPVDRSDTKIIGLPEKDFQSAQLALAEAFESKELTKLNAEIERLIDERDELMFALALKAHPEQKQAISALVDGIRAQKRKKG